MTDPEPDMTRSLYLHLDAPQASAAETAHLTRLAGMIKLVAALPDGGGVVLVSTKLERAEVKDLILMHRGAVVCDCTKIIVGAYPNAESAAAGYPANRVFLAPGYRPRLGPDFWRGALEFNAQGGWWKPAVQATEPTARSIAKPRCWEETAPICEPEAPPFASVTLAPLPAEPANDCAPWQTPQVSAVNALSITVELRHEPDRPWPFRLYAPLPLNCGGGLNRVFQSQEAADAGLAAFVGEVRAILTRSAEREVA